MNQAQIFMIVLALAIFTGSSSALVQEEFVQGPNNPTVLATPLDGADHAHHAELDKSHHKHQQEPDGCSHQCPNCCQGSHGPTLTSESSTKDGIPVHVEFLAITKERLRYKAFASSLFRPPRTTL